VHLLVTAGPTREHIDDIRFLSNGSTGKMGFEVAKAAARRGYKVTLISGPTSLPDPKNVRVIRITTAREMLQEALTVYPKITAVVATAAVSDYRPSKRIRGKKKKGKKSLPLSLTLNPDILKTLGKKKGSRTLVGFALEVQNARINALKKCREKNLDLIVLNDPSSLGAERMKATIYRGEKVEKAFTDATKRQVADWLVRAL